MAEQSKEKLNVSVAMATYNGERFLYEQLESIRAQTLIPSELVVCDDVSTDSTIPILERFSKEVQFPVRIYRNRENLGSTKNFEKAINLCCGDFVILADQDDIWHPEKLKMIQNAFLVYPTAVGVFSDAEIVDSDGKNLGIRLWKCINVTRHSRQQLARGGEKAFRVLLQRNIITGATLAFKRRYFDCLAPIPKEWVHDAWITILLSLIGPIYGIEESLINYRQHESNQIGIRKGKLMERAADHRAKEIDKLNFKSLIERLTVFNDNQWPKYAGEWAQRKFVHLEKRTCCHSSDDFLSIFCLVGELCSGKYHLYSNGFLTFFKDIMSFFIVRSKAKKFD